MTTTDIYARTTRNRLQIADLLEGLSDDQWSRPTLCPGWTVRHLAAHLVQPMLVGFGRFLLTAIRYRGDTDATVDHFAQHLARREPVELVALLRAHAADRVDPPRVGPMGPFAETCVHLRDVARPLGLDADVRLEDWLTLIEYLTSGHAAPALVRGDPTQRVTLHATDAHWQRGTGPRVAGTLEALSMTICGRTAALDELHGPGVTVVRSST